VFDARSPHTPAPAGKKTATPNVRTSGAVR
jgi:hypothetical protein